MSEWYELEKDELLAAVAVLNLVPQRAGIPSSDFVKITRRPGQWELSLASTVTGMVRVPVKGEKKAEKECFLDRGLLLSFIQTGKTWKGLFKASFSEGILTLKQGSRLAELAVKADAVGGYGKWKERSARKDIKLSEGLRKLLLASNFCSTADPALPHLNCVYIGGKLVLSTNLISLFVGVRQTEDALRIPFPVGIIPLLGDSLVRAVGVEDDRIVLDCGCGYIEGSVSAIAQKDFPKKNVVEKIKKGREWPVVAKLPAEKLSRMLKRLADYLKNVKREDWVVQLDGEETRLKASIQVQQGRFEEEIKVDQQSKEILLRWPLDLALSVIEYMAANGEVVKVRVDEEKGTPYLLSGGGVEMMLARQVKK